MRLRDGTAADIDVILHHRREMFREMGHEDPRELDEVERISREYLARAIGTGEYHALLAEALTGEVIAGGGVVVASWPGIPGTALPRRAWILNVYVEPGHRRRGTARLLMKTLIEWCRSQGLDAVSLHASEQGRPLYEDLGFRPTNEMRLNLDT